ncbi:urease accessory protein UreF [Candidatus Nitrosocosmicus hydrocola]|uniref:urease accessory protein UreF n=1 Tax=Candidatus Nitrosocosmicus hydrocola TaxID=1826872 RepID=UPI000A5D6704|nr:urease accessory UreF family protein [Candidatus Nitrosocosmicus hydrocola]
MHTDKNEGPSQTSISIDDLSFLQLSDSFFPTGLYTTSNGLELLFYNKNRKLSYGEISDFIKAYLVQQMGPTDCCVIGNIYDSLQKKDFPSLLDLDITYYFMRLIDETRSASTRSGIQFLRCVSTFVKENENLTFYSKSIKDGLAKGVFPVSYAIGCNSLNLTKEKSGLMLLYGFVVSVIGAALRLGILQHYEGQMMINELKPVMLDTVLKNIKQPANEMWQFIPQLDIIQMHHEQMDSKMFIT